MCGEVFMEYTKLGKTGIEVSRIGFGVLTVGATQQNVPPDKAGDLISYAMEQGINFFDTAQYYKTIRIFIKSYFAYVTYTTGMTHS